MSLTEVFVYVNLVFNLLFTGFLGLVTFRALRAEHKARKMQGQNFKKSK